MNVILSIKPQFCKFIFDGVKRYEYRKRVFKRTDIDKVYIYASKPICKIVGYFTIDDVIEDSPNDMWKTTHEVSGITKEYFDAYFSDCDMAHAIAIGEVVKFDTPIDPYIELDNFHAPQNFMYVDDDLEKLSVCFTQKR
jgi:predicted transcriptional regulator